MKTKGRGDEYVEIIEWLAYHYPGIYRNWRDHLTNEHTTQMLVNIGEKKRK